jgi:site-specific DNA-methyltransferase (adenine-specific)
MLINGDCIEEMKTLISDGVQVDSVVCDPPYEIGFMGKGWDSTGIAFQKETWELVFQLLKPGGHLLAFSASRTYHRMAVAIEDSGFEIRDQIMWLYGSGFPKSLNIGKSVDKKLGNKREVVGKGYYGAVGGFGNTFDGNGTASSEWKTTKGYASRAEWKTTKGNSEWEGWGTTLKPAHEPVVMARKPISEKTVTENVLKHGTGGINIDGCRIETDDLKTFKRKSFAWEGKSLYDEQEYKPSEKGRFPANIIHDGSDEVVNNFPITKSGALSKGHKQGKGMFGKIGGDKITGNYGNDKGSASRFFYCAKVAKKERNIGQPTDGKNNHPTVKPIKLMEYLCRLVTPKGGIVLDPFMGSGTTIMAAKNGGFKYIGIEKEKEYFEIANSRIDNQPKNLVDFL